jgi:type IV secretion system T-DNA border endonuclease VirD2
MGLESALWEATRPAFRVRYIHDPASTPRVPLYASYGIATGFTARAKLARIVRKAPEVVVKVTGRQRGGVHVKAHLEYIGRKGDVDIETRDGEILTTKEEVTRGCRRSRQMLKHRHRALRWFPRRR